MAIFTLHPGAHHVTFMAKWKRLFRSGRWRDDLRRLAAGPNRCCLHCLQFCLQFQLSGTGGSFREQGIRHKSSRAETDLFKISTRTNSNRYKLLLRFLSEVCKWGRMRIGFEFRNPKFFSCSRIECPEAVI